MKYRIFRTSDFFRENQPCANSYQDGTDEFDYPQWYVDINSLDDLNKIIEECGRIVLKQSEIEIYDTYRE